MDDATLAKDLLMGKDQIQMRRYPNSSCIKFFMRPTNKSRRKDKKFLKKLGQYIARTCSYDHKMHFHDLNVPGGETNDYLVMELSFDYTRQADNAEARWRQYKEVAFGAGK